MKPRRSTESKKVRCAPVCSDQGQVVYLLQRLDAAIGKTFVESTGLDEVLTKIRPRR